MVPGHFLAMLTMVRSSLLFSAILCSCLNFGFPPQCPHIEDREIEPFFCHAGSGRVSRVWSAWEKSVEILHHSRELNTGHGEDRQ